MDLYFRLPLLSIGNLLWGHSKIRYAHSEIRQAHKARVILSISNLLQGCESFAETGKMRVFTWGSTAVATYRDKVTRGNRILFSAGDILESITLKLEEEPADSGFITRGRRGFLRDGLRVARDEGKRGGGWGETDRGSLEGRAR